MKLSHVVPSLLFGAALVYACENSTYSNCLDAEVIRAATESNMTVPIIGYIHEIHINCWNFTCNVIETIL